MHLKVIFGHPKWPPAVILWKKSCVLIWNGEKCIRKWFSVIQIGRRPPFCEKNKSCIFISMSRNAIESDFRSSKMAAGSHFVKQKKVAYWSEMTRNVIESDFRSSKMGGGGGGLHNGQPVNHLGIYTNSSFYCYQLYLSVSILNLWPRIVCHDIKCISWRQKVRYDVCHVTKRYWKCVMTSKNMLSTPWRKNTCH